MTLGDRVYVLGYIDEIRKDVVIIRNSSGYFGTEKHNVFVIEGVKEREAKNKLVRCKDCAYYLHGACDNNDIYMNMTGDLIGVHFEPEPDFYCPYGERKEE